MQSTIFITELKVNARLTDSAVPVDVLVIQFLANIACFMSELQYYT